VIPGGDGETPLSPPGGAKTLNYPDSAERHAAQPTILVASENYLDFQKTGFILLFIKGVFRRGVKLWVRGNCLARRWCFSMCQS
jgi:hypothetical protein